MTAHLTAIQALPQRMATVRLRRQRQQSVQVVMRHAFRILDEQRGQRRGLQDVQRTEQGQDFARDVVDQHDVHTGKRIRALSHDPAQGRHEYQIVRDLAPVTRLIQAQTQGASLLGEFTVKTDAPIAQDQPLPGLEALAERLVRQDDQAADEKLPPRSTLVSGQRRQGGARPLENQTAQVVIAGRPQAGEALRAAVGSFDVKIALLAAGIEDTRTQTFAGGQHRGAGSEQTDVSDRLMRHGAQLQTRAAAGIQGDAQKAAARPPLPATSLFNVPRTSTFLMPSSL